MTAEHAVGVDPVANASPAVDVVVCIPTYRRVSQLVTLLEALGRQQGAPPFDILVGNNDHDGEDLASMPVLHRASVPRHEVITEPTRGVTAVRNTMIAHVLARPAPVRWIACLDDDQIPAPDWLQRLFGAGVEFDADLVGGPVLKVPTAETFWARGVADTSYLPVAEGLTPWLNEAGNLLLATRYLRGIGGRPPFSPDFGQTGGEDYEFFLFARSRNARIVWAPDAVVSEGLPVDRLTLTGFLWRFYSTAAYQIRADLVYHPHGRVLAAIAWHFIRSPAVVVRSIVRDRDAALAVCIVLRTVATTAGRLAGFFGVKAVRYGAGHPAPATLGNTTTS